MDMFPEALLSEKTDKIPEEFDWFAPLIGDWDCDYYDEPEQGHKRHVVGEWIFRRILAFLSPCSAWVLILMRFAVVSAVSADEKKPDSISRKIRNRSSVISFVSTVPPCILFPCFPARRSPFFPLCHRAEQT